MSPRAVACACLPLSRSAGKVWLVAATNTRSWKMDARSSYCRQCFLDWEQQVTWPNAYALGRAPLKGPAASGRGAPSAQSKTRQEDATRRLAAVGAHCKATTGLVSSMLSFEESNDLSWTKELLATSSFGVQPYSDPELQTPPAAPEVDYDRASPLLVCTLLPSHHRPHWHSRGAHHGLAECSGRFKVISSNVMTSNLEFNSPC